MFIRFLKELNNYLLLFRTNKSYSSNKIISDYCNYPSFLYIPRIQHGFHPRIEPWERDLDDKKTPIILLWSKRNRDAWKEVSKTPSCIIGAPFIHYRRRNTINKCADAKGTIAYPAHSTPNSQSVYDIEKYCRMLMNLPSEFSPVTISLHYLDYNTDTKSIFEDHNFKVITSGNPEDERFVERYYKALSKHKYATSNISGSYILYSVEMDIPFFLYGNNINVKRVIVDKTIKGNKVKNTLSPYIIDLFSIPGDRISDGDKITITNEQKEFVMKESGINDCLTPNELKQVLLKTYFLRILPMALVKIIFVPVYIIKKVLKFGRS